MPMKTATRRAVLAGAAGVACILAPAAVLAAPDDPIFAAIELHRQVLAACEHENGVADQQAPPPGYDPWNAPFTPAQEDAHDRLAEAELALACMRPTTLTGIAAIMAYVRECEEGPNKEGGWYDVFPECSGD